jgi:16S rRNA (adenine1518-N6/adenine1519-N6)-dimethyltransferase
MTTKHVPRKRFGQHFLRDKAVIQHIVAAIAPKTEEHLVEIGPGQGALTLPVLELAKRLDVVELDRDLLPLLEEQCRYMGRLDGHLADALEFDFASLQHDERKLRIIGNLPYNISTPLIFHLLTFAEIVSDMVFMLQKEVADRLAAAPRSEHYGRLSVMTQYFCKVQLLFDVPPSAFYPPPKVMSSIVRLVPYSALPFKAANETLFAETVKQAFGQRRKTLRNSLKQLMTEEMWQHVSVRPEQRPEELSVKEFVELSNAIAKEV